jgi:hypothetical protein
MITKINNLKNNLSKLSKSLMVGALMSLGFTANAQICNASYTRIRLVLLAALVLQTQAWELLQTFTGVLVMERAVLKTILR